MEFSWIHILSTKVMHFGHYHFWPPRIVFLRCVSCVFPVSCWTLCLPKVVFTYFYCGSSIVEQNYHDLPYIAPGFSTIVTIFQNSPQFYLWCLHVSCACLNKMYLWSSMASWLYYIQNHIAESNIESRRFPLFKILKQGEIINCCLPSKNTWRPSHRSHLLIGIVNAVEITCTASTSHERS